MTEQTHNLTQAWPTEPCHAINATSVNSAAHPQSMAHATPLDNHRFAKLSGSMQSIGLREIRYPHLRAKLDALTCALRMARDRHSDEHNRLHAAVQAFVVGVKLLSVCRQVLPSSAQAIPEILEIMRQLREVGIEHTDLAKYLRIARDDLPREHRDAIENCFRNVLDPQLGRIGRYRTPGAEFVLLRRRIDNPNDRLIVVWDDEIQFLCNDLSDPAHERRRLSGILKHTTPCALNLIEDLVERSINHPEAQLIPDSIDEVTAYPHIGKRFFSTGTLDLHPHRHGADNNQATRAAAAIDQERTRLAHDLIAVLLRDSLEFGWDAAAGSLPDAAIRAVLEIILDGVTQLSPSALRASLRYAYATTTGIDSAGRGANSSQHLNTRDIWICSLGGDEDTPPMVEGCMLDMLLKLRQLERLYEAGVITTVPELWCVATFHSQAAENTYTKAGQPIDPARHTYHARLVIERIHAFVKTYFPDVAHRCRLIEFPSYATMGSARALFAAVWQRLPHHEAFGARFAAFRGGVYASTHDRITALFAGSENDVGTYPIRHVFSNGLAANDQGRSTRLLRWAPMSTEPLFWIVSRMAYMEMLRYPAALRADVVSAYAARGTPEERAALPELLREIAFQQAQLSTTSPFHGQIGIAAPALYYRRAGEPTLAELAAGGIALLARLATSAADDRRQRLRQMCGLYERLEALPGAQAYPTFLAAWAERLYSGPVPPDVIASQIERTRSYIIRDFTARSMFNFWLS